MADKIEENSQQTKDISQEDHTASLAKEMAASQQKELLAEKEEDLLSKGVSEPNFTDFAKEDIVENDAYKRELDFILDIPLDISVELGRTKLLINELLQLGQGSVIELNKLAGELLEIYVNGKLIARGEAVVVNEKFGIRLTDIISPTERVKQLS
ncbi:MAG: flagellar motor switch protein FliN [Desulfovibrionaceae bacterium]